MSKLHQEIATYNRHLPELLSQQGKFVLIKGTEIAGTFDSYLDALTGGYERYKLDSSLVRQIIAAELPNISTRARTIRALARCLRTGIDAVLPRSLYAVRHAH